MRYGDDHKPAVRQRIVEAASRALRASGLDGVGIPAIMRLAGLSHGGFYNHFKDRDELVIAAVEHAGNETTRGVFSEGSTIEAVAERYLSTGHRLHRERGCVVAALAAESTRQPAAVRHAFGRLSRGIIALVHRALHPDEPKAAPSDQALVAAATMIGAVILSRTVEDERLATRILDAARGAVTS